LEAIVFYLVVDTNVLLRQLETLQQFVIDIEHHLTLTLQIIIPGIVISELDRWVNVMYSVMCIINSGWTRHKTRDDKVAWAARLASTWLLEKVRARRFVKGQTYEETCNASGKWNVNGAKGSGVMASIFRANNAFELIGISQREGSEMNDDLILDCCQYFASARDPQQGVIRHVVLCSGDKNLCLKVESVGEGFLALSTGMRHSCVSGER